MMFLPISLVVGGVVFVPLLVIAILRFKSTTLAVALSATFAIGATLGLFLSLLAADALLPRNEVNVHTILLFVFGSAGSIGGATIALWLLRKGAGNRKWEQH
jgi:hypothetical protein